MKRSVKAVAAAVAITLGASPSFAGTQFFGDRVSFSAFGSVGAAQTNSDEGKFRRDNQDAGADQDVEFNVDSNLGLQLSAKATDWLSATVQSLTMQGPDGHFGTEIEWAYVKVQPTHALSALIGRMTTPMFLVSDFRNVGYANTWLRPPNEVYGMAMVNRLEGANVSYKLPIAATTLTVTALGGKSSVRPFGTEVDMNHVAGLNVQWELDWLTLRAGRLRAHAVGIDDIYTFSGIGASVDRNNVIVQTEVVRRRSSDYADMVDCDGWYMLTGYRLNKFVPYASYASTKPKASNSPFHLSESQSTIAAGLRWDAFSSSAIKFQVERIDTHNTRGISFSTPVIFPGVPPVYAPLTKPVTAVSLAMDVVF